MYTFLSSRNLTANPLRSTLTALAIAVGVAMVLAASIVGQAANERATIEASRSDQALTPFDQPAEANTLIVQIGLGITGVMLVFAAGFVILNAFAMTITARQREIGALRALGMTRRQVTRAVLVEAGILGFAGVGVGIMLGLVLAWGVKAAFGTLDNVPFRVPGWGLVLAITLGLVITIGAALHPARRASQVPPLSAIRPGGEYIGESRSSQKRGMIGVFIIVGTMILLLLFGQIVRPSIWLAVGVATLGFILLLAGMVLALPSSVGWVAQGVGKWLVTRFGVAGRLAADNFQRNPARSALTTGGMIAGLTTIIILSGLMTVLLEQGFTSFALMMREDRFIAPNIVTMFEAGGLSFENMSAMAFMSAPLDPGLVTDLETMERNGQIEIEMVGAAPIQPEFQITPGFPAVFVDPEIYLGVGSFDFYEGDPETALAMMVQGNAVLVMPLIADRFGASVGDAVPVQTPQGEVMFTIAGIGGNGWNMAVFSLADGARYFDIEPTLPGIIIPEGQDQETVLEDLENIVADYPDRMLLDMPTDFLDVFEQVQGQFRALLNALLSLAVLLAGLGVVNTMVINIAERGREIGMLRAVGATRRQVRQSIVIEATTLGLMAAIISILLSFLMITVFITVVAPNAPTSIGLRLNSEITRSALSNAGQDMGKAALFSLVFAPLVAAIAAYYPARQAAALDIIEATRSERLSLKTSPSARPEMRRLPRDILWSLARRNLDVQRTRTVLSAFAVALGSAMIISVGVVSDGVLEGFGTETAGWLINGLNIILGVAGVIVMLAAAFLMFNALMMAVTERQTQIGALRSLGATRRQTMGVVMREALLTGVGGSLLGLLLGPLLGGGVLALMKNSDISVGQGEVTPGVLLLAFTVGVWATLLATWIPARRAANISPLVALRPESEEDRDVPSRVSTLVGVVILLGLVIYLVIDPPGRWVESPWEWIMSLGLGLAWFLGVLLVLSAAVGWLSSLLRKPVIWLGGTTGRLIVDNIARSRRRVTLTVFAFVIGLGMISGQNGIFNFINNVLVVGSFERQIQQSEWQVAAFNLAGGVTTLESMNNVLSQRVVDAVNETVGDRALVGQAAIINSPEISYYPGFPSMTMELSLFDRPDAVRFSEGDQQTMLAIMEAGCGVLVFPGAASSIGYQVGDTVQVTTPSGPLDCVVAAVGVSLSIFSVVGLTPEVRAAYEIDTPGQLIIVPDLDTDRDALEADLRETLAKFSDEAWLVKPEENLKGIIDSRVILDNVVNVTLLMAIVAAALGVINTTAMSVTERRRELGLLRAVGMTRRGVLAVVVGEAAFLGLLGGLLGLVLGLGISMIFGLSYGGNLYGLKLDLWPAAWEASVPVVGRGVLGLIAAPIISAFAAWIPARSITRGTAVETLKPEAHREPVQRVVSGWLARGSIRTRFVVGTGVLLVIVLASIIGFVTNHARIRLIEQVENVFSSAVAWNASALEAALPDNAENLSLEYLRSGQMNTDTMLRFQAISQDRSEIPLGEFLITDREGIVLMSLDPRQIGRVYEEEKASPRGNAVVVPVSAPVRNREGDTIGRVHAQIELTEIENFLDQFRSTLWTAGGVIILLGLLLIWGVSTPLVRVTRGLAAGAVLVGRGEVAQVAPPKGWLARHTTLRTRLTAAMVLLVVAMVGGMEVITIPAERDQLEQVLVDNLVIGGEWFSQILSENLESLPAGLETGLSFEQVMTMMGQSGGFNPAQLQELTERARGETIAYAAFVDLDGQIVFSDQLALIGETVSAPERTIVEDETWRDEAIWALSVPLTKGEDGDQVGVMRTGIRRASVEAFLDESRLLLRLFMLTAVLAAVLLAQIIGGAVTQPIRQLAADTRRVAQGDLTVQFRVDTKDEMAVLATAFNQMVAGLREREWLRDMFGRFVSQEVAEAIRTGQVRLEGENRVVSVLFCDIRGFTARSERHTPEEVVALLNEYLPVVVEAAQAHQGTVNKFGGDSTLVIYGAPRRLEESAYQAVLTALEMRANLQVLNEQLAARGEDPIRIGVGINTGMVLAGAVGPEARQEYTVIGDTVNLASRIEALNKEYPDYDILISGQTYDALGSRRAEFDLVDLGEVAIRGKVEGVRVWAVRSGGQAVND